MTCFKCDALVPDGSANCPRCGAKLNANGNGTQGIQGAPGTQGSQEYSAPWNRAVNQPRNYAEEKRQFVLEAKDSLKKMFFIRMGQTLVYVALLVLALLAFMSSTWTISENSFVYGTLPKILNGVNIVLWILLLFGISDLKGYEERFGTVLGYAALVLLFSLAEIFFSAGVLGLLISLGELISGVLFMYHYCGSFADLTENVDSSVSSRWRVMLIIYIGKTVLSVAGILLVYFQAKNAYTYAQAASAVSSTLLWSFILSILQLVVMGIELIIFSKTVKSFEK